MAAGVVDAFRAEGLKIFGRRRRPRSLKRRRTSPRRSASATGIPTAEYETFTDVSAAHAYVAEGRHCHQG